MILVHSENANRSMQVKREVERATIKGVPIIPFRIEDVPASKFLEYHLSTAYWLDAVARPLEPHLRYLREVASKLARASQADEAAVQPSHCLKCGAVMPAGAERCEACGLGRVILTGAVDSLPATGRRWKSRRRWPFRLRSRWAKIGVIAACVAALALGVYFGTRKSGVDAYFNRAQTYLNNQEFDLAIEELTRAITEDPARSSGYRFRGYVYLQRAGWRNMPDDLPRAVADFSTAVKLDPRDVFAYSMLGRAYLMMGETRSALEAFENALKIDQRYLDSLKGRGLAFYIMKDYERAIRDFTKAHEISPKDAEVLVGRGDTYLEKRDYASALADYQEASDLNPSHPLPYKRMSEVKKRLGKLDEAIELDRTAIRLSSGQQQAAPAK
jgi:tetratricopeptide (TPR) repeat protein